MYRGRGTAKKVKKRTGSSQLAVMEMTGDIKEV